MQFIARTSSRALPGLRGSLLLLFLSSAVGTEAEAQAFSPYSDFQAMSLSDMDSLRVKLTYGGPQDNIVATLVVAAPGTAIPISMFTPFHRSGFDYSIDDAGAVSFTASRHELKSVIHSVRTLPRVTDGNVDPGGYVSFALLSTAGGTTKAFEAIMTGLCRRGRERGSHR